MNEKEVKMFKKIGKFSQKVVEMLNLDIPIGTDIFLSENSCSHIKKSHPDAYKYISEIANILECPDFVRYNPKNKTVDFIRIDGVRLRVPVRPSSDGIYFVRSLFLLHEKDFERLKRNNSILPIDKN
jgi:hypothetical protein